MKSLYRFVSSPSQCGYLPDQDWRLEYDIVAKLTRQEYMERLLQGWRRFGHSLFRPRCRNCQACESIRVLVDRYQPNRNARRVRKMNTMAVSLTIDKPSVTREKLDLYDRYHAFQAEHKGWPQHPAKDAESYAASFVLNPFPTEEWRYYYDGRLVGVGYVDSLSAGLSAIYFFYDPSLRKRSLGTWNILCLLDRAAQLRLPHLYLGYYVAGCPSMQYKATFTPNEVLGSDGVWRTFRT